MKHPVTIENMSDSYDKMIPVLRKHFTHIDKHNPESVKLANEYYKWVTLKTNLIMHEKSFQLPDSALPNTIKLSSFQWLHSEKQNIVLKYYQYDKATNQYIISVKKETVSAFDKEIIIRSLVLTRKTVIWVDFGYNIGSEFGGTHPAIILKNLKDSLIVIPLSSQEPKSMDYSVKIDKVYGFADKLRWANVTRITQVSLSRVHFRKFGDVKPTILTDISKKLISCGIISTPAAQTDSNSIKKQLTS